MADALASVGWHVAPAIGRGDDPRSAAMGVDLCLVTVPDAAIPSVAGAIDPVPTTLVAHLAGSLGPDALAPHPRRAALHPLASLPDATRGARALLAGVWWAVDGDPAAALVVADLRGQLIEVPAAARAAYHAAACIAANHLVALLAQVERIATEAGLPAEPFYALAAGALTNARTTGAVAALTGPAARGDRETIARHLDALAPAERDLYRTLAAAAAGVAAARDASRPVAPDRHRIGADTMAGSSCR